MADHDGYPGRLPLEVWTQILAPIYTSSLDPDVMGAVESLAVCWWWKNIAERALYCTIYVSASHRMGLLASRMMSSTAANAGPWVERLIVRDGDHLDDPVSLFRFFEDLNIILLRTTNLKWFNAWLQSRPLMLSILSTTTSANLQHLVLLIGSETKTALHVLNGFQRLATLHVHTLSDFEGVDGTGTRPWTIPSVQTFLWAAPYAHMDSVFYFFGLCRFDPRYKLDLQIPHASRAQSQILDPLFQAHERSTEVSIHMSVPISEDTSVMAIPCVTFNGRLPPASLFLHNTLPNRIKFVTTLENLASRVWDILVALEARKGPQPLHVLQIGIPSQDKSLRFRWYREQDYSPPIDHLIFTGRLLPYAIRLYDLGLRVLDGIGHGLDEDFVSKK